MTAVTEVLDLAAQHECSVAVSGLMLKLRAPEEPPAVVLDQLRQHKLDIIGHLLSVPVEWAELSRQARAALRQVVRAKGLNLCWPTVGLGPRTRGIA